MNNDLIHYAIFIGKFIYFKEFLATILNYDAVNPKIKLYLGDPLFNNPHFPKLDLYFQFKFSLMRIRYSVEFIFHYFVSPLYDLISFKYWLNCITNFFFIETNMWMIKLLIKFLKSRQLFARKFNEILKFLFCTTDTNGFCNDIQKFNIQTFNRLITETVSSVPVSRDLRISFRNNLLAIVFAKIFNKLLLNNEASSINKWEKFLRWMLHLRSPDVVKLLTQHFI